MNDIKRRILISEGARDKALEMFMPYLEKRGIQMSISQLKQALLTKFVSEAGMHSLSLNSNFYLLGVARYYFEGKLTSNTKLGILYPRVKDKFIPDVCTRLDALVNILRNAYVDSVGTKWEQPEDFGNLPIEKLFKKYNAKINKVLGIGQPDEQQQASGDSQDTTAGKGYTYEILYSYEDAKKYNRPTEPGAWCITYGKQHYDAYVKKLGIHYVVFRKNGFENVPRKTGPGFTPKKPHDEYGNSLICVLQSNKTPDPVYITSRWNHGSWDMGARVEADHAYTTDEFLKVIGADYSVLERAFGQWKEAVARGKSNTAMLRADRLNALRQFKYAQMMINGGANPFSLDYMEVECPVLSEYGQNPKGLYFVSVKVNENEHFYSIMDRKVIMFDKYMVTSNEYFGVQRLRSGHSDKFVALDCSFTRNGFMIWDRMRHRFMDVNGEYRFNYGTSNLTARYESDMRYGIVAMTGNQVALVNLDTMKPVKARNGSAWFEAIVDINAHDYDSNRNYNGTIHFPYLKAGMLFRMVYDSSANEVYYFDSGTDRFFNPYDGVPEGFELHKSWHSMDNPGSEYLMFVNDRGRALNGSGYDDSVLTMFKDPRTGEFFSVSGHTLFNDFRRCGTVIGFVPADAEEAYYIDMETNQPLMLDGKPVTTQWKASLEKSGDYIAISLGHWHKATEGYYKGHITHNNFWENCLLYNPYTKEFYHDDISGYIFHPYGNCRMYKSLEARKSFRGQMSGWEPETYEIPSAQKVAQEQGQSLNRNIAYESKKPLQISLTEEDFMKLIANAIKMLL